MARSGAVGSMWAGCWDAILFRCGDRKWSPHRPSEVIGAIPAVVCNPLVGVVGRAGDERCPMCDVGGAPCLGAVPRARWWWCGEFGV